MLRERRARGARRQRGRRRGGRRAARRGHARPAAARRRARGRRSARRSRRRRRSSRSSARSAAGRSPTGCVVSERRIPIGVVGANFEARPNVALDVAGQLLKSLNAGVLRTGGAALRTVTALVDEVLRPALAAPGSRRRRSASSARPTARARASLVSLPELVPLVILRGSGATHRRARAARGRARRPHARPRRGRRRALRPRRGRTGEGARAGRGEPRPARRLQPAQPRARRPRRRGRCVRRCSSCSRRRARGARRACAGAACRRRRRSATSGRATPSAWRP